MVETLILTLITAAVLFPDPTAPSCHQLYHEVATAECNQGLIEPLKAARGHATSNADSVDREM